MQFKGIHSAKCSNIIFLAPADLEDFFTSCDNGNIKSQGELVCITILHYHSQSSLRFPAQFKLLGTGFGEEMAYLTNI